MSRENQSISVSKPYARYIEYDDFKDVLMVAKKYHDGAKDHEDGSNNDCVICRIIRKAEGI